MPLVWRFLVVQYLKTALLSVTAFVAILLTTRLDDIMHFASLGADPSLVIIFTLNQLPYILPIAIPLSCLIAAVLVIKQISNSHELTALRACGMSLWQILFPILIASCYIALLNFFIISEIATNSHHRNNALKTEIRSDNPLLVLHHKHALRTYGLFFESLGSSKMGESAEEVVAALSNSGREIQVLASERLDVQNGDFTAKNLSIISPLGEGNLLIENIAHSSFQTVNLADLIQQKIKKVNNDYLNFALLRAKISEERVSLKDSALPALEKRALKRSLERSYAEALRRISVAFSVASFTLLGCASGINISRHRSFKGMVALTFLASLYLVCYFGAKGANTRLFVACLLYGVPHLLILLYSLWTLKRIENGVEG